jgi:D-alanyl-D-alanine endopeptidase (penicillin-binding protein 7)
MTLSRGDLLTLAVMASENRAAAALARTYPGGTPVLVAMMNAKAQALGMEATHFEGPVGLQSENVSTARDLVKMVLAAQSYEHIQRASTQSRHVVQINARKSLYFGNTNPLVRSRNWEIGLSKTGYISEAGRCLVMQAKLSERPTVIVLLDSWGKNTRVGDANRIKSWMERPSRSTRQSRMR